MSRGDSASSSRWEGNRHRKRRKDLPGPLRLDIESANNQHQQQVLYSASSSVNGRCKYTLPSSLIHVPEEYTPDEAETPDLSGFGQLSLDKDMQVCIVHG